MKALQTLAQAHADPVSAARRWKADGGRVVGYLCDNVPDALIAAAGFLPLRVRGNVEADKATVSELVDRLYTPEVTVRPPFVTALLAQLLNGAYRDLDYLIVPHNRDAIQAIYRQLQDAARARPDLKLPVLYYLDKAWAPGAPSAAFDRNSILALKAALEGWSGCPISPDALSQAMDQAEQNRRRLAQLQALRIADPPKLSGVEALQAIGAASVLPKAEHSRLLDSVLAEIVARPGRTGPRLFVGGSPLDHTLVYEAIEAAGATVIAEDHCWGARAFDLWPSEAADPIDRLADAFHARPACSISFPMDRTVRACASRATAAKPDAAIFYVMTDDWSQNWETPAELDVLQASGIPCLHLRRQSYAGDAAAITAAVAAFLADLPERRP